MNDFSITLLSIHVCLLSIPHTNWLQSRKTPCDYKTQSKSQSQHGSGVLQRNQSRMQSSHACSRVSSTPFFFFFALQMTWLNLIYELQRKRQKGSRFVHVKSTDRNFCWTDTFIYSLAFSPWRPSTTNYVSPFGICALVLHE